MATVNGVVEAVSTKFGKFSIMVNGNWYATKMEWAKVQPNKGDTVTFDDGGGKFLKNVKITGGGEAPSATPATVGGGAYVPKNRGTFPIGLEDGQRSIIRQNALTNARELVVSTISGGKFDKDKTVALILEIAKEFEAYTAGDIERYAAESAATEFEDGFSVE